MRFGLDSEVVPHAMYPIVGRKMKMDDTAVE
jgi:hypothetical protein